MTVLAIVVTHNAMKWIDRCLNSLLSSSLKPDIFVIDNHSTDGTDSYIREQYKTVLCKQTKKNLGFGQANNIAFNHAVRNGYDYVYLLNQDAWVNPSTIEDLISVHKSRPEFGVLSPIQLNDNGALDEIFRYYLLNKTEANIIDDYLLRGAEDVYTVQDIMAAHWLLPVRTIKTIGGFSPSFYHYGEDDNYIDRIEFHGFKCGICTKTFAVHDRAGRKCTADRDAFYDYIRFLVFLNNPGSKPSVIKGFKYLRRTLIFSVRNKSLYPFFLLFKLIFSVRESRKNRNLSKKTGMTFLYSTEN